MAGLLVHARRFGMECSSSWLSNVHLAVASAYRHANYRVSFRREISQLFASGTLRDAPVSHSHLGQPGPEVVKPRHHGFISLLGQMPTGAPSSMALISSLLEQI